MKRVESEPDLPSMAPRAVGARNGRAPFSVSVIGLRGIPRVQGGIETHVEALYPLIAREGVQVDVYARRPFLPASTPDEWRGVRIRRVWSPRRAGVEAFVHSALCVAVAGLRRPDVVHLHGIGPALMTLPARALGLTVVVTHHGRDYEREKWGPVARGLLRFGETVAARFANAVICVARNDAQRLVARHGRADRIVAIPNGVPALASPDRPDLLAELGIATGRYVLNVARWVPEKRQLDLVRAFEAGVLPDDWKLVLVGSADHESAYTAALREAAARCPRVVLAGRRSGGELSTLYRSAGLYALPSTHEGMPITLLEALDAGLPCLVSDIAANREVTLPESWYFKAGDPQALGAALAAFVSEGRQACLTEAERRRMLSEFQWPRIALATLEVLRSQVVQAGRAVGG